jgi:tRNA (guanine37-N1)-methyltransferase
MRADFITIFPGFYEGPLRQSLIQKALEKGLVEAHVHNLRDYAAGKHACVDDEPYGGSRGMVFRIEPIARALEAIRQKNLSACVVLPSAQGRLFRQETAAELARVEQLIFVCPRYKGVDERVVETLVDRELCIGDYVIQGGDAAAWVMFEASVRLVEGVVGAEECVETDSFFREPLLEGPQYTRPREFLGSAVPEVLTSGDHGRIAEWRRRRAVEKTLRNRPDLVAGIRSAETLAFVKKIQAEYAAKCEVNAHG